MLTELSAEQVTNNFLNKLLEDAGMDNVSADVRQQMFTDLKNRLEDRFLATIIANLQEEQITTFRELLENGGDADKINQFLSINLPNANELFAQSMLSFRDTYLGLN